MSVYAARNPEPTSNVPPTKYDKLRAASDNNGKVKDVKITSGSAPILLKSSAKMPGDIERRKLTPQINQSSVCPNMEGLSVFHTPNVTLCQSNPVSPPNFTMPTKTSTPAASKGTYRKFFCRPFARGSKVKGISPHIGTLSGGLLSAPSGYDSRVIYVGVGRNNTTPS